MATPSTLQLAALEPQLIDHDARMALRTSQIAKIQKYLGKTHESQLSISAQKLLKYSPDNYKPVFYRVPVWLPPGMDASRVIRRGCEAGIPMGEGFRALHLGRSNSRWVAYGPLDQSEAVQKRMVLIDPESFRVWSIGEVEAKLQAILPEKIGE